jgi:hypothetical protein
MLLERMAKAKAEDIFMDFATGEIYSRDELEAFIDKYTQIDFVNDLLTDAKALYIIAHMVDELLHKGSEGVTGADVHRVKGGRYWACQNALTELIQTIVEGGAVDGGQHNQAHQ